MSDASALLGPAASDESIDHALAAQRDLNLIALPDDWRIDGDSIERLVGDLRVRVEAGQLVIEGGDVEDGVTVPLVVVHAATKLAEVTEILDQERSRLLAERFEGR